MSDNVVPFRNPKFVPMSDIQKCVDMFLDAIGQESFTNSVKALPEGRYSAGLQLDGKVYEIVLSVIEDKP